MLEKIFLWVCVCFFFLSSTQTARGLMINEIMYNPSSEMGDDSDLEWIELYNANNTINLINYSLDINGKLVLLPNLSLKADSYIIIARELDDSDDQDNDSFSSYYGGNISAIDASFTLSNTEGRITINYDNDTISRFNYSDILGADGNGYSLVLINNTWIESTVYGGTPGKKNIGLVSNTTNTTVNETTNTTQEPIPSSGLIMSTYLEETLYTGIEYTKLFRIQNLDHIRGETDCINATIRYEIYKEDDLFRIDFTPIICMNSVRTAATGYFLTNTEGNYTLCGNMINATQNFTNITQCQDMQVLNTADIDCNISIAGIFFDKFIYEEDERISYKIDITEKRFPFEIVYSITDVFNNTVKKPTTTENTNKKSFTPKNIGEPDKVFSINAEVIPHCNDLNLSDNKHNEFLVVTSSKEKESQSRIEIKEILTKEALFGSAVITNLIIYKGDTNKRVVKVYATTKEGKKISEDTKVYLKDKFTNYDFNLPVQLRLDCEKKQQPGSFYIAAEGLDAKERQRFMITGWKDDFCPKEEKENIKNESIAKDKAENKSIKVGPKLSSQTNVSIKKTKSEDMNFSKTITGMTVYKSAAVKSVELLPYLFFIASAILSILIIIKKL